MSKTGAKKSLQALSICLFLCCSISVSAVGNPDSAPPLFVTQYSDQQEVFLSFNYRNLFEKVIIAYYEDGKYYLPVVEIFSSLKIPNQVNSGELTLEGSYLEPDNRFRFNFRNYRVSLDSKGVFEYDATQMQVKELDFYVQLEVLAEVFELNFTVDLNNLLLQLQTPHVLPIVEEQQRAERRKKQELLSVEQNYYPLVYDRERDMFGGGFLDYSLSANLNETSNFYNYNFDLGTEVLGGDLQGSAFGSHSEDFSNFTTSNLRWRYVLRNNEKLTQIFAGQTNSDGLIGRNFTGIRLTNEPIEPRFLYDSYEIEGRAVAGSEVELYYNNALYDYKRVTDTGQYRFLAPLTYGTSRLRLRIYGPDGRITEREERIQIPFSFLPKGEFSYHLNAGRLDNTIFGSGRESNIVQGDFAYGISNWLTQKAGIEYLNEFSGQSPLIYGSTSARLLDDYLLNLDVAPSAFYRFSGNVVYPSSASWGLNYTYYTGNGIYNPLGNDQEISGNLFFPFQVAEVPFNIRLIGNYAAREPVDNTSYNIDLNSRINRLNIRLSYRDRKFGRLSLEPGNSSSLSASGTYLISRSPEIPRYLQNTFISGRLDYNPGIGSFEQVEVQASRSIFDKGRVQASVSRNFIGDFNYFNVGITIDFNALRTTSTIRNSRNQSSFTQNIRGSIGYDDFNKDIVLSNRQQVGRSAASLRLYVDANNSGSYDEEDDIIDEEAVRIGRAGVVSTSKNGILRFSQLQAYHRVNMEINQAVIQNPLLIPQLDKFSIVTDPNQYKPINIPFYVSGVIEGRVQRLTQNGEQAASGIRLFLKAKDRNFEKEMQTFSDGSFYAYEIPPGDYTLEVDSTQLSFLNARTEPDLLEFKVQSLAQGDFIDGLKIKIVPLEPIKEPLVTKKDTVSEKEPEINKSELFYQIQLASYATADYAFMADKRAEDIFADAFYLRYNPLADLYALRSAPLPDKDKAVARMHSILDSPFNEPAIVVSRDTAYSSGDLYPTYAIELGRLQERSEAENNAAEINKVSGIDTEIIQIENEEGYLVRSKGFNSREEAAYHLSEIRKTSLSEKASFTITEMSKETISSLAFNYSIQISPLDESTAREYLNLIKDRSLLPEPLTIEVKNNSLLIKGLPTWRQTITLKRTLEDLLSKGTPIIILEQYEKEK